MDEGPRWFRAKRFGWGAGVPVAWQGWAVIALYLAIVCGATVLLKDHRVAKWATIVPATMMFMLICARTTRDGWRWRWGDDR
jgi:hypothetical protein